MYENKKTKQRHSDATKLINAIAQTELEQETTSTVDKILFNLDEVSKMLDVSTRTVLRYVTDGALKKRQHKKRRSSC